MEGKRLAVPYSLPFYARSVFLLSLSLGFHGFASVSRVRISLPFPSPVKPQANQQGSSSAALGCVSAVLYWPPLFFRRTEAMMRNDDAMGGRGGGKREK